MPLSSEVRRRWRQYFWQGQTKETLIHLLLVLPEAPSNGNKNGKGSERRYEHSLLSSGRQLSERGSTNRNLRCRIVLETYRRTRTEWQVRKNWVPFDRHRPHVRTESQPTEAVLNHYPTTAGTKSSKGSSLALMADLRR